MATIDWQGERITAADLREGDVVAMAGDTQFTVERVTHRDGYHEVVWADTNEGQPYAYMGDESWPCISRIADGPSKPPGDKLADSLRDLLDDDELPDTVAQRYWALLDTYLTDTAIADGLNGR